MVPRAVLIKSSLVSLNTARQVNTPYPKIIMNSARPMTNLSKSAHSTVKWPIHKNTTFKNCKINQRVITVKDKKINTARPKEVVNAARPKAVVNVVKRNNVNAVKASACWVWKPKNKVLDHVSKHNSNPQMDLQDQGVIDNGCSRHMTGNMSYLTNYEEIDGGYVAFRGNPKGGKITGKYTIKTGNLDFENEITPNQATRATTIHRSPRREQRGTSSINTIRLVQNGCSIHGLQSEDPNQHLKDFLKLVDSLDLNGDNRERTRLRLFQFSLRDQASNWLERLLARSIIIWEDLTTRFLA
ncbi:hypothetical protein Tco_0708571 [Tanacetum coccineum]